MKRVWARPLFGLSLVAALIQQVWIVLLSGWIGAAGSSALILPLLVDLFAIYGIWISTRGGARGWLR